MPVTTTSTTSNGTINSLKHQNGIETKLNLKSSCQGAPKHPLDPLSADE